MATPLFMSHTPRPKSHAGWSSSSAAVAVKSCHTSSSSLVRPLASLASNSSRSSAGRKAMWPLLSGSRAVNSFTPTVSKWPMSRTVRPLFSGWVPRNRHATLARPSAVGHRRGCKPVPCCSWAAISRAQAISPAVSGLMVGMATKVSVRWRMVGSQSIGGKGEDGGRADWGLGTGGLSLVPSPLSLVPCPIKKA